MRIKDMNKLPIYHITLGDAEGILKMSLVDTPAVEVDFLKFNKEAEQKMTFSLNEDEHIVFGCAMRADYPIYRFSPSMGEYYVVFTKENIKVLYEKFMFDSRFNDVNLNHFEDTKDVHLLQSFIKDTNKGINPIGFEHIEDGSWFVSYKVKNDELWEKIKNGEFNGFSIEGFFDLEEPTIPVVSSWKFSISNFLNKN